MFGAAYGHGHKSLSRAKSQHFRIIGMFRDALLKRVNINIPDECHHLLKTTCVALGISINDFVHKACQEAIFKHSKEDEHLRNVVVSLRFPEDSKAFKLQQRISDS